MRELCLSLTVWLVVNYHVFEELEYDDESLGRRWLEEKIEFGLNELSSRLIKQGYNNNIDLFALFLHVGMLPGGSNPDLPCLRATIPSEY